MRALALALTFALLGQEAATEAPQGRTRGSSRSDAATVQRMRNAVETRFRQLEATSTVRLRSVAVTRAPTRGAVLEVALASATEHKFEFYAETAYMLVWQALKKQPRSFKQLRAVRVSLNRPPHELTVDCPIESVEDSNGFTDFARLKRLCSIERAAPGTP